MFSPRHARRAPAKASIWKQRPLFAALMAGLTAVAALAILGLPAPLILPVLSSGLIVCAGAVALLALHKPVSATDRISPWDICGALTFLGCCAALLSEPEAALPLFEQSAARK